MTTDTIVTAVTTARSHKLSDRLDREWAQMCRRPGVIATVRTWDLTDQPFATLEEFLALTGFRAEPTSVADELLGRLVTVAATDPMAARIVLQRILPGLLTIVKVEQDRNPSVDAFDLVVGEAWLAITRYRVDARPTHIAARILHDARHRAFTHARRRRVVTEVVCDAAELNEIEVAMTTTPFDDLVSVIDEATRRGLGAGAVDAVRDLLTHGTAVEVAAAQQRSTRAVRYRQQHAVSQIRRLVAA